MASGDSDVDAAGGARSISDLPLARRIQFWLFAGLVVLALVFYVSWGLAYGIWLDNGVYAVAVVPLLIGLAGMWLTMPNPRVTGPIPR